MHASYCSLLRAIVSEGNGDIERHLDAHCFGQDGLPLLGAAAVYGHPLTGQELASAGHTLRLGTALNVGAYKLLFHLGLMAAMQGVDPDTRGSRRRIVLGKRCPVHQQDQTPLQWPSARTISSRGTFTRPVLSAVEG